jgi:hypothetical protein
MVTVSRELPLKITPVASFKYQKVLLYKNGKESVKGSSGGCRKTKM